MRVTMEMRTFVAALMLLGSTACHRDDPSSAVQKTPLEIPMIHERLDLEACYERAINRLATCDVDAARAWFGLIVECAKWIPPESREPWATSAAGILDLLGDSLDNYYMTGPSPGILLSHHLR